MTPEEENLGNRSHKEWLEGHNPNIMNNEIYAADCVIYGNHMPSGPAFWLARASSNTARPVYRRFPDMKIHHDMVVTEEDGQYQMVFWTFEGTHLGPHRRLPAHRPQGQHERHRCVSGHEQQFKNYTWRRMP